MKKMSVLSSSILGVAMLLSPMFYVSPALATDPPITAPTVTRAMAMNSGGTSAIEAGDSVRIMFSKTTNKFAITAANIATEFSLNNSHSFLDGAGAIGSASWSDDGKKLTITFSSATSLPTVVVGDTVTILGTSIKDLDNNAATGNAVISGSFIANHDDDDEDEGEDDDGDEDHHMCGNTLMNGKLYKIGTSATVYLASSCRLKAFRGAAVFHSRGKKFQNIITLPTLPAGVTISTKPVLPAEGTLVRGTDKTVWFVDHHGKRKGFVSSEVFTRLGFKFDKVERISDSDLSEITTTSNISADTEHPDGALIKCGNSADVFLVIGGMRFPFANAEAFTDRGHSFEHILNVDCGRFAYQRGAPITR